MELELEGNLVLERPPTRRWIAIIAVVVPVVACVCSVAWFVRAFIAPPMANVSSPMQLAAVAPTAQRAPLRAEAPVAIPEPEPQPVAANEAAQPPPPAAAAPAETPASLPMFATLSAAPPSFDTPAAFANPAQDAASRGSEPQAPAVGEQTAMLEPSTPIAGRIPIPHPKPHFSTALVTGPVPLPRPRPTDSAPSETPDLPAFDRHAVE